MNKLPLSK